MINNMRVFFYNAQKDIHWKLPSRERLFMRLGEYDTMAEFTVLSERYFEAMCNNADSYIDFVNNKAAEYEVKIKNGVQLVNYREALYKSFMVNSHAMLNDFVVNFRNDMKLYIKHDFTIVDNQKLSLYERLAKSMIESGYDINIPLWLNKVAAYYRLVRNHVAHIDSDEDKCFKAFKEIDLDQMCNDYPVFKGKAPNPPGQITMDDFYLYSASIKHIANLLTISIQGKEK